MSGASCPVSLLPAIRHVWQSFGEDRLIFGSDWPVCLLAAEYREVKAAAETCLQTLGAGASARIWGGNAIAAYHLDLGGNSSAGGAPLHRGDS